MLQLRSLALGRTAITRRYLTSRASRVLSAVGIPTDGTPLPGVYDGSWKGSGEEVASKCPATGETLATVRNVAITYVMIGVELISGVGRGDKAGHPGYERGWEDPPSDASAQEG